jgi:hypothetical protein
MRRHGDDVGAVLDSRGENLGRRVSMPDHRVRSHPPTTQLRGERREILRRIDTTLMRVVELAGRQDPEQHDLEVQGARDLAEERDDRLGLGRAIDWDERTPRPISASPK